MDDFEQDPKFIPRFGRTDGPINTLGLPVQSQQLVKYEEWVQFPHGTHVGFIEWNHSAGEYRSLLADGGARPRDVSGFEVLSLRAAPEFESGVTLPITLVSSLNTPFQPQRFTVSLEDSQGRSASVDTRAITLIPYPYLHHEDLRRGEYSNESDSILKTIRIPLGLFRSRNPALDLTRIARVMLSFERTVSGDIAVDSIEFSK